MNVCRRFWEDDALLFPYRIGEELPTIRQDSSRRISRIYKTIEMQ
jgi:hypothetical protein